MVIINQSGNMLPAKSISFKKPNNQFPLRFIIYAHFESLRIQKQDQIQHVPCGFGYSVKCSYDPSLNKYEQYLSKDCVNVFLTQIKQTAEEIKKHFDQTPQKRTLNDEEKNIYEKLTKCYICKKQLNGDKHQLYDSVSGNFLGASHASCTYPTQRNLPVIIYNFGKYGTHFLQHQLPSSEIKTVGNNQGFIMNWKGISLRFLDSKQILNESITDLEKMLPDFKKTKLKAAFGRKKRLVAKPLHLPYMYLNDFQVFNEGFTAIPGFYDTLHESPLPEEDYQRCVKVWERFSCQTMKDYFYIFLKSRIFLLEDIFENFRQLCLNKYQIDVAHYFTIASFSWDSMLKHTEIEFPILTDPEMVKFIKDNLRGGVSQCSKRHAKANNIYCSYYDRSKPSSYIIYLDANNLGGWAMTHKLPFSHFQWVTNDKEKLHLMEEINRGKLGDDVGYILEVDLKYPHYLHSQHNDLPFCVVRQKVKGECYTTLTEKPVLTLANKEKYVIEYRLLMECVKQGLILTKIHRVLKYTQIKCLESYVLYNTDLRAQAETELEKNLYKLLNNSITGKTSQKTGGDTPFYAAFAIYELSKMFLYQFHYNVMLPRYLGKIRLLYTDTDSLIYEIFTEDFFHDLAMDTELQSLMDTSNLDQIWGIPSRNQKVIGKMKDEYCGKIIREFFGVGAKVYFLDVDGEEVKKSAGMKTYVKKKFISREDYANCVLRNECVTRRYWETTGQHHQVVSTRREKKVLSPGDNKRYVLGDNVETLAWGHNLLS